jgi:hypothetical protein
MTLLSDIEKIVQANTILLQENRMVHIPVHLPDLIKSVAYLTTPAYIMINLTHIRILSKVVVCLCTGFG